MIFSSLMFWETYCTRSGSFCLRSSVAYCCSLVSRHTWVLGTQFVLILSLISENFYIFTIKLMVRIFMFKMLQGLLQIKNLSGVFWSQKWYSIVFLLLSYTPISTMLNERFASNAFFTARKKVKSNKFPIQIETSKSKLLFDIIYQTRNHEICINF